MNKEQQLEIYREFFQAMILATEFDKEKIILTLEFNDGSKHIFDNNKSETYLTPDNCNREYYTKLQNESNDDEFGDF